MEYSFLPDPDAIIDFNKNNFKKKQVKQSFYEDVKRHVEAGNICFSYMEKSFVLKGEKENV
jgi:hypothetical protein